MSGPQKNIKKKKTKNLEIHFVYMFVIFTLFTAFLVADRWTGKGDFTTYLTNVATFVSVVLGLVAIFYSFISNSSLSQSLGNISKVSEEVLQTKNQISSFLDHAVELEKSSFENSRSLKEVSFAVEHHVSSLKDALQGVSEKTQLLHDAVGDLPDKLKNRLDEASNESGVKNIPHIAIKSDDGIDDVAEVKRFLAVSSLVGRLSAYACVLAQNTGKNLSIVDLSREVSASASYIHGFLVAMIAIGYVEKNDVAGENRVFEIVDVNENIKNSVRDVLISSLEKRYKDEPTALAKNLARVERLEKYFAKDD